VLTAWIVHYLNLTEPCLQRKLRLPSKAKLAQVLSAPSSEEISVDLASLSAPASES
jgi:hypothetical protein